MKMFFTPRRINVRMLIIRNLIRNEGEEIMLKRLLYFSTCLLFCILFFIKVLKGEAGIENRVRFSIPAT
jgi:hypothetical protein